MDILRQFASFCVILRQFCAKNCASTSVEVTNRRVAQGSELKVDEFFTLEPFGVNSDNQRICRGMWSRPGLFEVTWRDSSNSGKPE